MNIKNVIEQSVGISLSNVPDISFIIMFIIAIILLLFSIFAVVVQIYLAIKYLIYNRTKNSIGLTGEEIARKILDDNGLSNIKVKGTWSFLFGNSYSHYFKKIRLRSITGDTRSVTALGMAAQKSSLAILDKENDPDMKKRNILTPFVYFGPLFCLPLIIFGIVLDSFILKSDTYTLTLVLSLLGLLSFLVSFIMSIMILKTEVKAQNKAYEILKNNNMATEEELTMLEELFKLYNIEYINNIIMSLIELVKYALQILSIDSDKKNK